MFFEVAASIISFGEGKVIRNLNSQGNKVESKSDMLRYYFVTLLMAILILFVRSFDSFIHPISGWEDTTEGLNYYTSTGATILHSYAGYVSFLPNIVDWMLIKFLPLQAVPFGQAYFALLGSRLIRSTRQRRPQDTRKLQNLLRACRSGSLCGGSPSAGRRHSQCGAVRDTAFC